MSTTSIRFSGLASGMDTESMVKQLVDVQKGRLIKLQQAKMTNNWKTDTYRDINTKLASFRTATENLRLQSSFNKQTAFSSNSAQVASTVIGTPTASSYNITEATMATEARAASVGFTLNIPSGEAIGQEISFTLNGTDITLAPEDTISSAITKINNAGAGVKASHFKDGNSIILTSTTKAASSQVEITNLAVNGDTTATSNRLGLFNGIVYGSEDTFSPNNGVTAAKGLDAKNAMVTINGLTINPTGNSFTFDGIKFDLKSNITSSQPVTVETKTDTGSIFENIKTFVEKYNELVADLNSKITEKRYRDFSPLTDEQKSEMSDREIELWEEKAKSGLLTGDRTLSGLLNDLRNSFMTPVANGDEGFKFLSDIGITTSKNYRDNGKLELDETKLKAVLESNLSSVRNLFSATSSITEGNTVTNKTKHDESGIGRRLYERLGQGISDLGKKAGSLNSIVDVNSVLAKELKNIESGISREQDRLLQLENRYWKQFQAMENAMQKANSQSGWLMQQFGGGM
ncbi:flagellar filament capping protein FliD [Metabacillus litoralis]|uniref:flagellar filament capping protein FliD n=1 Tax=Metabacillus litoralis TaxID=152268 RepID=UPI00203BBF8D|nr:flagellar filament capping protein FliD [Metabacillus litoralis]MCM3162332.1 flagellar filament capping protein FliD [Metabacillus litoralis]